MNVRVAMAVWVVITGFVTKSAEVAPSDAAPLNVQSETAKNEEAEKAAQELAELKKRLVGKPVWMRQDIRLVYRPLPDGKGGFVEFHNLEKMTVTNVDREIRGYMYGAGDFTLTVRNLKGKEGFVKYGPRYVSETDLIKSQWPASIKKAIKRSEVVTGMSKEQAKLVLGEPEKINETVTQNGKREQWVYGGGSYAYFTNEKLTAVQFSH